VDQSVTKLEAERNRRHARLREARQKAANYDAETEGLRAQLTERTREHPQEFTPDQKLPIEGTKGAKLAAKIKERRSQPNPHQAEVDEAFGPYQQADIAVISFKKERVHERLAEVDPDIDASIERINEGLELLKRCCAEYQVAVNQVAAICSDTPGLERRQGVFGFDPSAEQLLRLADGALQTDIARPGLTEFGAYWAERA
jgi:hypothetical protein